MIFLDLHKAYEALDRSRCLDFLEGYGVGPQACRIPWTYWRRGQWWKGQAAIARRRLREIEE